MLTTSVNNLNEKNILSNDRGKVRQKSCQALKAEK